MRIGPSPAKFREKLLVDIRAEAERQRALLITGPGKALELTERVNQARTWLDRRSAKTEPGPFVANKAAREGTDADTAARSIIAEYDTILAELVRIEDIEARAIMNITQARSGAEASTVVRSQRWRKPESTHG